MRDKNEEKWKSVLMNICIFPLEKLLQLAVQWTSAIRENYEKDKFTNTARNDLAISVSDIENKQKTLSFSPNDLSQKFWFGVHGRNSSLITAYYLYSNHF